MGWNPWAHISEHWPGITVTVHRELPGRLWGLQFGQHIILCRLLGQVGRRCTLTHEVVHLERGPVPTDPRGYAREERAVSAIAARRLITLDQLVDGLRWTRDVEQLADHLWVDVPTLEARMADLDPVEVAELENRTDGEWLWIP